MTDRHAGCRLRQAAATLTFSLAGLTLLAGAPLAAFAAPASAAVQPIDETDRVVLPGAVHPLLRTAVDLGRTAADRPMKRIILTLARRPGAQQDLDALLAEQADPASPLYHKWLTPQEFGDRFGASDATVQAVSAWLAGHGFSIDEVARGRGWIDFSGTVQQVEETFSTEMHDYRTGTETHLANAVAPSIPRALSGAVSGIVSLDDFRRRPQHRVVNRLGAVGTTHPKAVSPDYSYGGVNNLAPGDFATIYDVASLYTGHLSGSGQAIAIVARTDIQMADVHGFRSEFGLPANLPIVVYNGASPGDLGGDEETEADLDTEWSGATAPGATVYLVVSASTETTDGVDLSAQYIVDNNLAPVMSTSFGSCEAFMNSDLTFYSNLWSQAATQGITSMVSSGDSGAAGCQTGGDSTGTGRAVNGLCSTPYDVCVGGTELMDTANPSAYWSSTNNSTTQASALSYIPEMAWNESGAVSGGSGLWATGGGASGVYTKPSWQSAPGVPADGHRDVPDVALTAAGHDAYLVAQDGSFYTVGGTSAASPSFAGLMALVVEQTASRQGNANTLLYGLATNQYGGHNGSGVFHDVTTGSNTVPGVTGYACTTAYDQATGLGSVDAARLVASWPGASGSAGCPALAAPGNLQAHSNGVSATLLTWTAVGGATRYMVMRSLTNGVAGSYEMLGITTGSSYTDASLPCGSSVTYQVIASTGTCASAPATSSQSCAAASHLRFYSVTPCRVLDTRSSTALAALSTTSFQLTGSCGIPTTAKALSTNVTVVAPQQGGYVTLFAGGTSLPGTTTVSFNAGTLRANNSLITLGSGGLVDVYAGLSGSGTTNLLIDVNGYFQ